MKINKIAAIKSDTNENGKQMFFWTQAFNTHARNIYILHNLWFYLHEQQASNQQTNGKREREREKTPFKYGIYVLTIVLQAVSSAAAHVFMWWTFVLTPARVRMRPWIWCGKKTILIQKKHKHTNLNSITKIWSNSSGDNSQGLHKMELLCHEMESGKMKK